MLWGLLWGLYVALEVLLSTQVLFLFLPFPVRLNREEGNHVPYPRSKCLQFLASQRCIIAQDPFWHLGSGQCSVAENETGSRVGRKDATGPVALAADKALPIFAAFVAEGLRGMERAVAFVDAGLDFGKLSSKPSEDDLLPSEDGRGRLLEDGRGGGLEEAFGLFFFFFASFLASFAMFFLVSISSGDNPFVVCHAGPACLPVVGGPAGLAMDIFGFLLGFSKISSTSDSSSSSLEFAAADGALLDFAAFVAEGARRRERAIALFDSGAVSSKPSEDELLPSKDWGGRLREDARWGEREGATAFFNLLRGWATFLFWKGA